LQLALTEAYIATWTGNFFDRAEASHIPLCSQRGGHNKLARAFSAREIDKVKEFVPMRC